MEQGMYAQVVMILQMDSNYKKEKEKNKKYNFQGKSARSRRQFDIDHQWLEDNLRTREPDFYKNCIKLNEGVMIQIYIKYLEYQLVM